MNKTLHFAVFATSLLLAGCAILGSRAAPYPSGLQFPLSEAGGIDLDGRIVPPISRVGEQLVLTTRAGTILAIDQARREVVWRFQGGRPPVSAPVPGENGVYAWDAGRVIYALDREGRLLWASDPGDEEIIGLSEGSGLLLAGTAGGRILAYDTAGDRALVWTFQAGGTLLAAPSFDRGLILFGSDDGRVFALDRQGRSQWVYDAKQRILHRPMVREGRVYFATEGRDLQCWDPVRRKVLWRLRLSGVLLGEPVFRGRSAYFLASNSVLYCIHGRSGEIRWWRPTPSRLHYGLEVVEDKIVISAESPELRAFDAETGAAAGAFTAERDVRSNLLWVGDALAGAFDRPEAEAARLAFLVKDVGLALAADKPSPQKAGTQIAFRADARGFHQPRFAFAVERGGRRRMVRPAAAENTWIWFPEEPGDWIVIVTAEDARLSREAEVRFTIEPPASAGAPEFPMRGDRHDQR